MDMNVFMIGFIIWIYSFLIVFSPENFNIGGILAMAFMMMVAGLFKKDVNLQIHAEEKKNE